MSESFYVDSLPLEQVGDEPLLGFRIDAAQRSVIMCLPPHASQFRSSDSANCLSFEMVGIDHALFLSVDSPDLVHTLFRNWKT